MANNYFKFKQFTVYQDLCGMKVSTDACIQGAWSPLPNTCKNILDIGTGTGILSLMLAQRNQNAIIDAIEIDESAANQAEINFQGSKWSNRINLFHSDIKEFYSPKYYDYVICNPPFFINSLKSNLNERNLARHNVALEFQDIFNVAHRLLSSSGFLSVMLPVKEHTIWEKIVLNNNWHFTDLLFVAPRVGSTYNRVVSICSKVPNQQYTARKFELIIRNHSNGYRDDFIDLMSPFYFSL